MSYNHLIQKRAFSFVHHGCLSLMIAACSDIFPLKKIKSLFASAEEVHHEQKFGIFKNAYS
ncbi:hypothetical protein ZMO1_ZMO2066 [Zymomonas mobilis subsp. mobilis ZM4 = ATCC 31821]|uniref:Uncharacterized protein n=1 Tax=Zymomonas mobilis subsp. mobilis (strain ATCC 10988 / DSM 424 / LMG 404 / NCIMB 8938 / NRRL B-806 / ZM1) TaxID=555217 RepID=A0A0H3G4H5_ZYMMA|nr:hypothetical protein [Zymomonas mobilis]ACV76352.1 hypothetical protein Za10_1818 [Zymomonas mobilis subsp. mobilis NCIMB 11163]AEH63550.1 conserved hypothetical protein [Zymomonas mobilis subsp. mobilis ATCC 10988]ART94144.1 hypothetical protein B9T50_08525 [Zymomonas mobilis subsp. mobilis]MCP9307924.1 hypothetical protein [Zymomonas mobilis]QIZ64075.1 hypothetical protein ZMO1_ZMO2066 [Zymomonas mobilis subsp. mobilis ZM4 = ATCC 31821]